MESSTNKDAWNTDSVFYLLTLSTAQTIYHMIFYKGGFEMPRQWASQLFMAFPSSQVVGLVTHIYKPSAWEVEGRGA